MTTLPRQVKAIRIVKVHIDTKTMLPVPLAQIQSRPTRPGYAVEITQMDGSVTYNEVALRSMDRFGQFQTLVKEVSRLSRYYGVNYTNQAL